MGGKGGSEEEEELNADLDAPSACVRKTPEAEGGGRHVASLPVDPWYEDHTSTVDKKTGAKLVFTPTQSVTLQLTDLHPDSSVRVQVRACAAVACGPWSKWSKATQIPTNTAVKAGGRCMSDGHCAFPGVCYNGKCQAAQKARGAQCSSSTECASDLCETEWAMLAKVRRRERGERVYLSTRSMCGGCVGGKRVLVV